MAASHPDFRSLVRPELLEAFDADGALFEDKTSSTEEAGKFKVEGVYRCCTFRSHKCYYLGSPAGSSSEVRRMRSIPRKCHSALRVEDFSAGSGEAPVRYLAMRPTQGFEISVQSERRNLSHSINFRRRSVVSEIRRGRRPVCKSAPIDFRIRSTRSPCSEWGLPPKRS